MTATTERGTLALLDEDAPLFGPATRARLVRLTSVLAAFWVAGLLPLVLGASDRVAALGLGFVFPGAGAWATGRPGLALGILGAFTLALFLWWSMGPTVLPPLVWGISIWLGARGDADISATAASAVLAVVPTFALLSLLVHLVRHRQQRQEARDLNAKLREVRWAVPTSDPGAPPVVEHSEEDLRRLRAGLDTALQPLDSFEGFTHLDQFREGALRYQLNALCYGLAMSQFTRTPAFSGYLAEAQRNTIEKMLQRKVWGYWAIENLWGNLSLDRDPVKNNENVMLTGFFGLQVGMYTTLNDDRYTKPGSLEFRWSDTESYPYEFGGLASSIHRNVAEAPFTLFPCEPNWVYSICNTFGLNTVLSHDRLTGSSMGAEVQGRLAEAYRREFTRPDGRIIGVRSSHLGLSWNFWASPSVQLATAYWLHPGLPEVAQRTWWLIRNGWLRLEGGVLTSPVGVVARTDPGNYKLGTDNFTLAVAAMAGREMGDEEYARAAEATVASREPVAVENGAERVASASGLCNSYLNLARFGRHNGLSDLVRHGTPAPWQQGPRLAEVAYPEVLVAKAVTDGTALDLVLRPGAGPVRTTIRIDRLRAGARYQVSGATVSELTAGDQGDALVEIDLGARSEISLRPVT